MSAGLPPFPTGQQRAAADPAVSAWVTASAGTGKTRVLADRALRLLLAGTPPERILCITFTKAAAAEMVERIQRDLGALAIEPEEAVLVERIERLTGAAPDRATIERARRLFARVLDLPGGMAIQTIHAFCQSLLRRFPLEADIPPHFELIEERSTAELMREAREEVLEDRDPALSPHLLLLAISLEEQGLAGALEEVIGKRTVLSDLVEQAGGIDGVVARVFEVLDAPPDLDERALALAACADGAFDGAGLIRAARALASGSKADQGRAEAIAGWLAATPEERERLLDGYLQAFLDTKGQPRSQLATKGALQADPGIDESLRAEQNRLASYELRRRAISIARRTEALLRVAWAVLLGYERRKRASAFLDYDDLIAKARALLRRPGIAPWVLYKLDGGLDHLLVDEGQDTSPLMWDLVGALTEEFFAGAGARDLRRTLFVVGDRKQSIYSFQGADLASFTRSQARFRRHAEDAGLPWRDVTLDLSFRSTEAVLAAVDAVFADPEANAGVVDDGEVLRHRSSRVGHAGLVELWPLVAPQERADDAEDWSPPVERVPADDLPSRLARHIAATVRRWIATGEPLEASGRPIRAGDVLVLLPRRGAIQAELVRAFKQLDVPVAGADRMELTGELAVMDLMALGDALLLPEDDLTLATVLKGPLFGLSEDDLFLLCYDRGRATVLERLHEAARERPDLAAMAERFEELRRAADFAPPFEFYARVLADGGRRRLLTRLGAETQDPIEEFLAQALVYESAHAPSLQGFLRWLRMEASEVKRDPEQPRDEVRVMTVHGAKGLEAPIVILPDTHYTPRPQERLLWLDDGLPLWRMNRDGREAVSEAADQAQARRRLEEHRRLLYVALTRARDRLYVCGWQPGRKPQATPWYELVRRALEAHPEVLRIHVPGLEGEGLRLYRPQTAPRTAKPKAEPPPPIPPVPDWLHRPAPAELRPPRPVSPSRAGAEEPPVLSPLDGDGRRFRRGRIVHRLLQLLPDVREEEREALLDRHLERPALGLEPEERAMIRAQVLSVLDHPDLTGAFGPSSRAEQPLCGVVREAVVAGQIDRLRVGAHEVVIVDYKSGRRAPERPEAVPVAYLRQMATYRALLRAIYPDRRVRCLLVWTEGAEVTALPDALLDHHMPVAAGAGLA